MNTHRGHAIVERGGVWYYADGVRVDADPDRACGHCDLPNTPEGFDGCIGRVSGANNACCGHGKVSAAYVQEPDGSCTRGVAAYTLFVLRADKT